MPQISHRIVVRDYGTDGTGVSVIVHRAGCEHAHEPGRRYCVAVLPVGEHADVDVQAGIVAQQYGLDWFDFGTSDCALGV